MNLSGMDWRVVVDTLYKETNEHLKKRTRSEKEFGNKSLEYAIEQICANITLNIAHAIEMGRTR